MPSDLSIRVLLIEDNPDDAELVRRTLARLRGWKTCQLDCQGSLQGGLDHLAKESADVVLLDLGLPDSQGLSTLVRLRESSPEVPVVVFTTNEDMGWALSAVELGAQDYLVKDEIVGATALMRSIRYAIERARIAREKLACLGVLSAGVAMSFHQLLGSILDAADEATRQLSETPSSRLISRHLREIQRAALQGGEMAGRLRDYAISAPKLPHPVDISEVVRENSEGIRSALSPNIKIVYRLASGQATAIASRLQLHQVLMALVQNAGEAVGEGPGLISVSTGVNELDREVLRDSQGSMNARPGRYASLSVADTGHGMDAHTLAHIFDPYFTTKFAGRGLGLAAALGVACECRAVIRVESSPGKGSLFDVHFPLAPAEIPPVGFVTSGGAAASDVWPSSSLN